MPHLTTLILAFLALAAPAHANSASSDDPSVDRSADTEARLSGDWGGLRGNLHQKGLRVDVVYKADFFRNMKGGNEQKTGYLDNLDLLFTIDAEKLANWKGASFLFYGLRNNGTDPTVWVGDAQGTDKIQAPDAIRVFEAWLQQNLWDDKVSLLVGLHDLNTEFYLTRASLLLLNSSFGVGADLGQTTFSTFPVSAFGGRVRVEPVKSFYIDTALFDGIPGNPVDRKLNIVHFKEDDGLYFINEWGYQRGIEKDSPDRYGKYALGIWQYTRPFDTLNGIATASGEKGVNHGVYALAEQAFTDWFSLFVRYGLASGAVNSIRANLAEGAQLTGIIPHRPLDRMVFGASTVFMGTEALDIANATLAPEDERFHQTETAFEFTYRFEVGHGIAIQPDFQYVLHPGFDPVRNDALVFINRLEISL